MMAARCALAPEPSRSAAISLAWERAAALALQNKLTDAEGRVAHLERCVRVASGLLRSHVVYSFAHERSKPLHSLTRERRPDHGH